MREAIKGDPLRLDPHYIGAPGLLGWAALSILMGEAIKAIKAIKGTGVVGVGGLVDLGALDHQEEAFLAGELGEHLWGRGAGRRAERGHAGRAFLARELGEYLHGRDRHLAQARELGRFLGPSPIDLIRHVRLAKEAW